MNWTRSTYSSGGLCVEAAWTKSTHSNGCQACVEATHTDGQILVRDSKDPDGPMLTFTEAEWDAFLAGVRDGELTSERLAATADG